MKLGKPLLVVVPLLLLATNAAAQERPTAAAVCIACHGAYGSAPNLDTAPIIAGIPAAHIEEAIYAYIDGARDCAAEPAMCEVVSGLSEYEIREVANYFATRQRPRSGEPFDESLAMKGGELHRELCIKCHARPDEERAKDTLGFPLHGQRSAYLRHALESYSNGDRQTLLPQMEEALRSLTPDDIEALINFYASYEP